MTPQKIKLTRHDGAGVCPVAPETLVVVQYKDEDGHFYHAGFAADRNWLDVLAYAVIELVEPAPVIEVGDVVTVSKSRDHWVVIHLHKDSAWLDGGSHSALFSRDNLTLVRKGGAV